MRPMGAFLFYKNKKMAKSKTQKKEILNNYKSQIDSSRGLIVVKASGVTPNEVTEFRKEIHDFNSEFHVVKNSIFAIALKENELEEVEEAKTGENSVVYFGEDIVNPAKALKKFIEDTKIDKKTFKIEVLAGFLDGDKLNANQVVELAEMPDKEQSIAMILGIIDQAMSGVVNVLEDPVRSYATIIDQAFEE